LIGLVLIFLGFSNANELIDLAGEESLSLFNFVNISSVTVNSLLVCLTLVITLFLIRGINRKYRFAENNPFPILFFVIVGMVAVPAQFIAIGSTIGLLFFLISLMVMLEIYNQPNVRGFIFLSAVVIGIGVLFYLPITLGLLLLFITLAIFRPFELRNFLVAIVGTLLPLIYYIFFCYFFEMDFPITEFQFSQNAEPIILENEITFPLFLLVGLFSMARIFIGRSKFIVRQRNQLLILFCYLLFLAVLVIFSSAAQIAIFTVPLLAVFISYLHKKVKKKWILEAIGLLIIGLSFWVKLS